MSGPYLLMVMQFIAQMPEPEEWIKQAGWTKYAAGKPPQPVYILDAAVLVFDRRVGRGSVKRLLVRLGVFLDVGSK